MATPVFGSCASGTDYLVTSHCRPAVSRLDLACSKQAMLQLTVAKLEGLDCEDGLIDIVLHQQMPCRAQQCSSQR